jgi:two-component system, LuxR family, sensor kinase FixL
MSLVAVVWSMIAGACITVALVHLPAGWRRRDEWASLAFAAAALCTGAEALCELANMRAQTPAEYLAALRWGQVAVSLMLIAMAAFIYLYLDAGRLWLAFVGVTLRLLPMTRNFVEGQTLNYAHVSELREIPFLGEQVSKVAGTANPLVAVSQVGVLLIIVFILDATITAWRRGAGGVAVCVGASAAFFLFAGLCQSALVFWGVVEWPAIISPYAAGVLVVMGYAMSRDLANAKQLSIELRERNQEAALTAEAANLGTWTRDIAGDVILASGKTRELFGFAPGERLNLERVLERVHPDDRGLVFEQGQVPHSPHDGAYHTEFRVLLPDGRVRWIAHHGRAELDAGRRPVRTRGVSMDITSRKQADLEAARLRQDIAHVGRVSVMGQLASALAHEISQPLGAILRNAEAAALFMQDPSPDLAEIRAILEDIRKDDQRAGAVIDRMRALLRRQEVQMAALDVRQVLGDVTVLLRPDAAARHLRVDLDIAAGVPPVLGDRVQLQQVLLNLILNGMDALEGVGGDNRRVSVSAREASDAVEISVRDSGPGIADDDLERIFDPFFSTKAKGIGMGLSISRSIVEAHRGRLWAENSPEGGATFRFTLPIAPGSER